MQQNPSPYRNDEVYSSKESRRDGRSYSCTGVAGWWGRLLDGSGVSREAPAPFCERLGVRFPRPTHRAPQAHGKEVQDELTDCA